MRQTTVMAAMAALTWMAAGCSGSTTNDCGGKSGHACDAGAHADDLAVGGDLAVARDLAPGGDAGLGSDGGDEDGGSSASACAPVAAGQPGSFALAGNITKMVGDRSGCFVYALDTSATSKLQIVDTANKVLRATIALPSTAYDVDLSPNGKYLVVSLPAAPGIAIIDKATWTIANTITTAAAPNSLEVGDDGVAYYGMNTGFYDTHRIDLTIGTASDTTTTPAGVLQTDPDLELSLDGSFLYAGDDAGSLYKFGFSSGKEVVADKGTWDDIGGFGDRTTLLSPGGQHLYSGVFQVDPHDLTRVTAWLGGYHALAEDAAGTFVVTEEAFIDAQLGLQLNGVGAAQLKAAALSGGDRELWSYTQGGTMQFQNVADYLQGVPLGVRARPALPLSSYNFTYVVLDPTRPRLYGLDQGRQEVVAIDLTSGQATGGLIVGSLPNGLAVSPSGTTLYVAQQGTSGIGKIDLASWQYTGVVPVPRSTYQVVALGDAYLAAIDEGGLMLSLLDAATGTLLDTELTADNGALTATADGKTLFVAGDSVIRYDVSTGTLMQTAKSAQTFATAQQRVVAALPDGSIVFYQGNAIEGTTLTTTSFTTPETILEVTGDGRLALSFTNVYDASDGKLLGAVPNGFGIRAITTDGKTLYSVDTGSLQKLDLTTY